MVHSSSNDFKFAPSVRKKLSDEIKEISRIRTQTSIDRVINKLKLGSHEEMLKMLKGISPTKTWENNISELNTDHPTFLLIYDLTIAAFFEGIYELTSYQLSDFAHNVNYIAPLRASAERYYRVQGLAVREVDAQGQNLAMFLRNLSPDRKKKLNYWLAENFDFELEAPLDGGHLSLKLKQLTTNELFNLADMGFGFSQMIPILVQLWMISTGRHLRRFRGTPFIFAIEQPELHLHPRLQAKLADIFMSTITTAKKMNIDLRLVLETHSETMINHFGNKIAQGVFDHNDINVILFEKDPSVTYSNVMETGYDEEGFLKQWPYGFFEPED
ncbi:MAG: AAA family ATPase [Deltaproteobacteria bacterium]|nr:AAA family ATPase [Deltaproteobacteria bacterium]